MTTLFIDIFFSMANPGYCCISQVTNLYHVVEANYGSIKVLRCQDFANNDHSHDFFPHTAAWLMNFFACSFVSLIVVGVLNRKLHNPALQSWSR